MAPVADEFRATTTPSPVRRRRSRQCRSRRPRHPCADPTAPTGPASSDMTGAASAPHGGARQTGERTQGSLQPQARRAVLAADDGIDTERTPSIAGGLPVSPPQRAWRWPAAIAAATPSSGASGPSNARRHPSSHQPDRHGRDPTPLTRSETHVPGTTHRRRGGRDLPLPSRDCPQDDRDRPAGRNQVRQPLADRRAPAPSSGNARRRHQGLSRGEGAHRSRAAIATGTASLRLPAGRGAVFLGPRWKVRPDHDAHAREGTPRVSPGGHRGVTAEAPKSHGGGPKPGPL